jgi:hypothetical protein
MKPPVRLLAFCKQNQINNSIVQLELGMSGNDKNKPNSLLFAAGVLFLVIGVKTIIEPIYWFRGANVDFTGYNLPAGIVLILISAAFISVHFVKYRNHKK